MIARPAKGYAHTDKALRRRIQASVDSTTKRTFGITCGEFRPVAALLLAVFAGCATTPIQETSVPEILRPGTGNDYVVATPLDASAPAITHPGAFDTPSNLPSVDALLSSEWPAPVFQDQITAGDVLREGAPELYNMIAAVGQIGKALGQIASDPNLANSYDLARRDYLRKVFDGRRDLIEPMEYLSFGAIYPARALAKQQVDQARTVYGRNSAQHLTMLYQLGLVSVARLEPEDEQTALDALSEAVSVATAINDKDAADTVRALLGQTLLDLGRLQEAAQLLTTPQLSATGTEGAAYLLAAQSRLAASQGRPIEALRGLAAVFQFWESQRTSEEVRSEALAKTFFSSTDELRPIPELEAALALRHAASLMRHLNRQDQAMQLLAQATAKSDIALARYKPQRTALLIDRAELELDRGAYDDAKQSLQFIRLAHDWTLEFFSPAVGRTNLLDVQMTTNLRRPRVPEIRLHSALVNAAPWFVTRADSLTALQTASEFYQRTGHPERAEFYYAAAIAFATSILFDGRDHLRLSDRRTLLTVFEGELERTLSVSAGPSQITAGFELAQMVMMAELGDVFAPGSDPDLLAWQRAASNVRRAQARLVNFQSSNSPSYAVVRAAALERADPQLQSVWQSQQMSTDAFSNIGELVSELEARRAELARYEQAISQKSTGRVRPIPELLQPSDVRARIASDEAFILFVSGVRRSWAFVVTNTAFTGYTIDAPRASLERTVAQVREQLVAPPQRAFDDSAARLLQQTLFSPLSSALSGKRRLVIAANGTLAKLPFALLPVGQEAQSERRLIDDYAIRQLPAAWFLATPTAKQKASGSATRGWQYLGFAPAARPVAAEAVDASTDQLSWTNGADSTRGMIAALSTLPPLPAAEREVQTLAQQFHSRGTQIHLGEAADEKRLRGIDLRPYKVISFAAHGLMAGQDGYFDEPALVLAKPRIGAPPAQDNVLTASEVRDLSLNETLVLLSACNTTASETVLSSQQFSGLVAAFLAAGANSVLATHWSVADEPTAQLVISLGKKIAQQPNQPLADQLRTAMLEVRDKPGGSWRHPWYWAGFSLVGEDKL